MLSHKLRQVVALLLSAAALAACGDASTKSGSAPLPGEGEAFPFQINILVNGLTGSGGNVTLTFDQPLVMDSVQGNIVQVSDVVLGANGGASFTTNAVSFFAAGSGTLDVFVAAVLQASDMVTGTASFDGPTVTISVNNTNYPIQPGRFSIPIP